MKKWEEEKTTLHVLTRKSEGARLPP